MRFAVVKRPTLLKRLEVRLGTFDLMDPVLLSPALAVLPIIVVGEVLLRRAASSPPRS